MKAKKTSPKSIRFNIKDFEIAMSKGSFESAQEMVDFLLNKYANPPVLIQGAIPKEQIKHKTKSATQQIDDKIKKEEEKKHLENIIKSSPIRNYFNKKDLPDYDPEIGHEGITNPNSPF